MQFDCSNFGPSSDFETSSIAPITICIEFVFTYRTDGIGNLMAVSRHIRRALRERIFLFNKVAPSSAERKRAAKEQRRQSRLNELIHQTWYSETFRLTGAERPVDHFCDVGSSKCYAPSPELAGSDGQTLKPWAAELLLRLGIRIGAKPGKILPPDDGRAIYPAAIPKHQKRRIAVVTAVLSGIDRLLPVYPEWLAEADFYAFVDHEYSDARGWTRVNPEINCVDARRHARYIKTHLPIFFSHYDHVLWIDSNIFPCSPPTQLLHALGVEGLDFATFQHPQRSSLVMEAAACVELGKETASTVFAHLRRRQDAFSHRELPLFETNVMYLNPQATSVKQMCAAWWRDIVQGSRRDQLSLPIAIGERHDLNWGYLKEESARSSGLFVLMRHEKTL